MNNSIQHSWVHIEKKSRGEHARNEGDIKAIDDRNYRENVGKLLRYHFKPFGFSKEIMKALISDFLRLQALNDQKILPFPLLILILPLKKKVRILSG